MLGKREGFSIGRNEVVIDPGNLSFNEASLSQYLETESGWYDYFGAMLALAEKNLAIKDTQCDQIYGERFAEHKEHGGSDKLAEAKTKADSEFVALKEQIAEAKYKVSRLKQHLRAWDKNHENAMSMGHMLRKQIDKMYAEIHCKSVNRELADMLPEHQMSTSQENISPVFDPNDDLGGLQEGTNLADLVY